MDEVRKNFSWLRPSAAVLLTELSKRRFNPSIVDRGDGHTYPTPSTVVRKTCELLSFTEYFAFSDIDGNYDVCESATRRLEQILNDILDQTAAHAPSSATLLHPVDSSLLEESDINEAKHYPPSSFVPNLPGMDVGSTTPTGASSQECKLD
ncbi:Acyl-CoA N-acyltransferase [Penicillium sp. IBT 16267x]|nr:Acyl-CoA N-acyltransferase [Penicillium sp. IBT 16267x]